MESLWRTMIAESLTRDTLCLVPPAEGRRLHLTIMYRINSCSQCLSELIAFCVDSQMTAESIRVNILVAGANKSIHRRAEINNLRRQFPSQNLQIVFDIFSTNESKSLTDNYSNTVNRLGIGQGPALLIWKYDCVEKSILLRYAGLFDADGRLKADIRQTLYDIHRRPCK